MMPGSNSYTQDVFEGAKAFRHPDGEIYVFRFDQNAERLNGSADLLCMPRIPVEYQTEGLHALLDIDRLWYPEREGASIYVRPRIIAADDILGVRESSSYYFLCFLSPSGEYFSGGFNEMATFLITERFKRVPPGGIGKAKFAGSYGVSLAAKRFAKSLGAQQVLYLDPSNTLIEEAGSNNHFHVMRDGRIIIPEFTENILESITARSILELSASGKFEIDARQETIHLQDFLDGLRSGEITEAGGLGTAASITPARYVLEDRTELVPRDGVGEVLRHMFKTYTGIQRGTIVAPSGWLEKVERRF